VDFTKLIGLRPKKQTAETIKASILRVEEELQIAADRIAELEENRGQLFLKGEAKTIEAAEQEMASLKAERERMQAMVIAMRPLLKEMALQERAAEISKLHKDAEAKASSFVSFWQNRYATLAAELRDAFRLEQEAEEAISKLQNIAVDDTEAFFASGASIPRRPLDQINPSNTNSMISLGKVACLPPLSGQTASDQDGYYWGGKR
jgi:hypothetical protein